MTTCKVELIQSSKCKLTGTVITTLVCEYPRAIHAQLLTHRVFSKNSSSTRAVPIKKAVEQVRANPAKYIWTYNQSGMQGDVITNPDELAVHEANHKQAMEYAITCAETHSGNKIHKQNAGRYLEPFQNIRIVLTSTEWENWDWLRIDGAAQGEIKELAEAIYAARKSVEPMPIGEGEWHVPFVNRGRRYETQEMIYSVPTDGLAGELTIDEAKNISMSCCAQTSYRVLDTSLEKAEDIIPKLFNGSKVHASPSEHQASPVGNSWKDYNEPCPWDNAPKGVTHIDRNSYYWSGNFKNFIQNRQLLPRHDKAKF